ncbi:hypothetical protein BO86DRAFT_457684 [Aspergillus japonicus CBS 114.51]|uniref:Secreted protein n=1 Tax=Aspergillus japonicus CBS 114.51 TaxID=1448312 RepID=A0A8T8WUW7_ASPJA|nr:hypothetical protein BO86DRAFT_457684 [Aspergillus japonicus CBS 114.51]RAH79638.1 hypothetical protein BO86DRAFT_457684 [Aspergillus japonicus CBS 114.51]
MMCWSSCALACLQFLGIVQAVHRESPKLWKKAMLFSKHNISVSATSVNSPRGKVEFLPITIQGYGSLQAPLQHHRAGLLHNLRQPLYGHQDHDCLGDDYFVGHTYPAQYKSGNYNTLRVLSAARLRCRLLP